MRRWCCEIDAFYIITHSAIPSYSMLEFFGVDSLFFFSLVVLACSQLHLWPVISCRVSVALYGPTVSLDS